MSDSFEKSVDARAAAIAAAKTAAKTAAIAAAKTAAKKAATEFDPDGEKYDEKTGAELAELMPLNIDKPTDRPTEEELAALAAGDSVPERTHEGAFEAWVWHRANEDDPNSPFDWYKHKGSIDPRNGMLLKGMGHTSVKNSIAYEKEQGRHFVKGPDGRYYLEKIPAPLLTRRNPSQTFTSTPPAAEK